MEKGGNFDLSGIKKNLSDMESGDESHVHSDDCCSKNELKMSDMPMAVRRRVHILEKIQESRNRVQREFQAAILALERSFEEKYSKFDKDRAEIVKGIRDPTEDELNDFIFSGVEQVDEDTGKGIPGFWLTVLGSHPMLAGSIEEGDQEALGYLLDIRSMILPENPGFRLEFEFAPNPFFLNSILSKEYHLDVPEGDVFCTGKGDDYVYDHAVGTEINWQSDRNLCFKTITKVQRHRVNNSQRTVKRLEKTQSFFHFFNPPSVPSVNEKEEEDDEEELQELEARIQIDYEMGELLKDTIIPDAVNWFTGKALEYAEMGDDDEEGDYDYDGFEDDYGESDDDIDDSADELDDSDEDDSEDEDEAKTKQHNGRRRHQSSSKSASNKALPSQEKPDCKQQ